MKPYTVNFPEGTEAQIDHLNRVVVFNRIEKKINVGKKLPLSVEHFGGRNWYIDNDGKTSFEAVYTNKINNVSSKSRAEAFLALMQLVELRDAWNGQWRADWEIQSYKHCVRSNGRDFIIEPHTRYNHPLHFKSKDLAERFLEQFKELIETAKELI